MGSEMTAALPAGSVIQHEPQSHQSELSHHFGVPHCCVEVINEGELRAPTHPRSAAATFMCGSHLRNPSGDVPTIRRQRFVLLDFARWVKSFRSVDVAVEPVASPTGIDADCSEDHWLRWGRRHFAANDGRRPRSGTGQVQQFIHGRPGLQPHASTHKFQAIADQRARARNFAQEPDPWQPLAWVLWQLRRNLVRAEQPPLKLNPFAAFGPIAELPKPIRDRGPDDHFVRRHNSARFYALRGKSQ